MEDFKLPFCHFTLEMYSDTCSEAFGPEYECLILFIYRPSLMFSLLLLRCRLFALTLRQTEIETSFKSQDLLIAPVTECE